MDIMALTVVNRITLVRYTITDSKPHHRSIDFTRTPIGIAPTLRIHDTERRLALEPDLRYTPPVGILTTYITDT